MEAPEVEAPEVEAPEVETPDGASTDVETPEVCASMHTEGLAGSSGRCTGPPIN